MEGADKGSYCRVFCDVGHTSVAGDMMVSRRVRRLLLSNQGGTADFDEDPSLTGIDYLSWADFFNAEGAEKP